MDGKNLTKDDLIKFIKDHKDFLKNEFHISEIGIFGSFARDNADNESDIDLIIEFDNNIENIFEIKLQLKDYFFDYFHRDTDIARKKFLKPRIKEQILREAIYV